MCLLVARLSFAKRDYNYNFCNLVFIIFSINMKLRDQQEKKPCCCCFGVGFGRKRGGWGDGWIG
jgi:hypothetical protein